MGYRRSLPWRGGGVLLDQALNERGGSIVARWRGWGGFVVIIGGGELLDERGGVSSFPSMAGGGVLFDQALNERGGEYRRPMAGLGGLSL